MEAAAPAVRSEEKELPGVGRAGLFIFYLAARFSAAIWPGLMAARCSAMAARARAYRTEGGDLPCWRPPLIPTGSEGRAHLDDLDSSDHSAQAYSYPDHARSSLSCLS